MADEEEIDPERRSGGTTHSIVTTIGTLERRFQELRDVVAKDSADSPVEASSQYCQDFCRTLVEYAGCWKVEQDPLPLVEVYTAALLAYSQASAALSPQCDSVPLVLERLALSFIELLLSLREELPASFWEEVRFSVQRAHSRLQESGIPQLSLLCSLTQQPGVWASPVLQGVLSQETQPKDQVDGFLEQEGPVLLEMRLKQLMKEEGRLKEAEALAQACAEHPGLQGTGHFKQTHLICLCSTAEHDRLMEELSKVDCRDALEMICNLESDGDERVAFSLCSAFLTHQLLQADTYCAWELTLFWSKLLKRLESSEQDFLDRCRKMSMLSKTVFHILFLIKVVQSEMDSAGLPTCIEMCIMALQLESSDGNSKATICKTLSCLLSYDLEVKRACQLTEFLLEPTVDAYYAVESLYNEPDQKLEEENMPIPNSLRCELLLVFKTQWPFDPEFWDWRALKRQCLALMGEEASIVSSIDLLNDNEDPEGPDEEEEGQEHPGQEDRRDLATCFVDTTNELDEITDRRQKNREIKKLRQKGFVSARFRNFQVYMQYCVLCDKEFLGHRIVRHAQTHFKAGVYSCPICAETFTSKDTLVPHVASHVKQSSKERLTAMKNNKQLANPRTAAPVIAALKAKSENYLHTNGDSQGPSGGTSHTARTDVFGFHVKSHEENVCPVSSCKKSFKFLKNLLAHVKAHGDNEEAKRFLEMQSNKVVCQYCLRQFVNVAHLSDHLQVHCGVNPYICIQLNCKASFQSNPELLVHRKSHGVFKARCMFPNCGKIFNEAFKLYDHEAQHYKTFTCKVPDCGKLFHSQNQLELHQEEHATETTQEEQQITQQNSQQNLLQNPEQNSQQNSMQNPEQNSQQNSQNSGPSLIERMLSDSLSSSLEISHESKDFTCANVSGRQPPPLNSIESLLTSPHRSLQDFGQYVVKSECQDMPLSSVCQTQDIDTSAIRSSVNSNFTSHPSRPMASPETHSFDHLRAALQGRDTPSFEAQNGGLNMSNIGHANAFEDQAAMFSPNESPGSMMYSSNCNVTYPQQFQPTCTNMHPPDNGIPLGMCQTLPPSMTPLPPSGIRSGNTAPYPVNQVTPSAQERHHCAFGNCTRNYSSYRSVTKHMRAAHPEFYDQWKIARKNVKNPQGMLVANGSVGSTRPVPPSQTSETEAVQMHAIQKQVVHQPLPYPSLDPSSCYTSQLTSVQNHDVPLNMRNILNPIVVSQLASHGNPVTPTPQWQRNQGHGQIPPQVYPPNMQRMPQVDLNSGGLLLGHSMDPPLVQKSPHSASASYIDSSEVGNALQSFTSLNDNCSVSNYIAPAITKARETQDKFSSSSGSNNQYLNTETSESVEDSQNNPRKRPKWPPVVEDGKYSCPRCSRRFNCSKSLGGHLSKRLTCKPLPEAQQAADLPTSFLDFLNSEPTENQFNSQSLHDQSALHQEGLSQPVEKTAAHPNAFPASGFPQADSPGMGSEDDILKQIMAEANMADLFDQASVPQPFFQGTYGGVERMPQNSVIQHTGDVHVKKEEQFYPGSYLQSNLPQYSGPIYPDPILSQILSENQNVRPNPPSLPADLVTTNQQADIISNEAKQQTSMGQHSVAPSSVNQGETRWQSEQDVKKRLREQILSGDFTQRSSVFHSVNHRASASSNSRPSNSVHHSPSESRRIAQKKSRTPSSLPSGCPGGTVGFRGSSSQPGGSPTLNRMIDQSEPVPLSGVRRPWGIDGHSACGGPEAVGEVTGNIQTSVKQEEETGPTNVDPETGFVKPFACHSEDCTFRAMSSDVLWKHMFRVHNYTLEMINQAKQRNAKLAPFGCHKCSKAFTRNSNRRVHYQTAHRMSNDEISKLHVKPTSATVVQSPTIQNQPQTEADQNAIENESITLQEPYDCQPPSFGERSGKDVIQQNSSNDNRFTQVHRHPATQASTRSSQLPPKTVSSKLSDGDIRRHVPATPTRYSADRYGRLFLQSAPTPPVPLPSSPTKASVTVPLDEPQIPKTTSASGVEGPIPEAAKKLKGKKSNAVFNPYRPYCCVHEGCSAAFTVQHNLILHYRAIHQSALSVLEVNKEQDGTEAVDESRASEEEEEDDDEEVVDSENEFVPEFRCQEKDCCRVFQEVPSLLQHYLQLHEFSLDKAGAILSRINLGQFACDQQRCVAMFTSFWKYVGHIKELHGGVTLSRQETLNGFSCDVEDCDRKYATKYNLLRHTMKKHPETYQLKVLNQTIPEECAKQNSHNSHYPIVKAINGKENIQSNKKLQKVSEKKRPEKTQKNNWTKYGKPSLKSKGEASALCTKKFTLQYPCMLAGCESVMRSERSIMKHYMGHGLSERYLEEQRSHYIFCKKFSRLKHHSSRSDDSKSDNSSDLSDDDLMADTGLGGSGYLSAKPGLRKKRAAADRSGGLFDGGPSDEDSDSVAVSEEPIVVKRKRGRPRKLVGNVVKPKAASRSAKRNRIVHSAADEETDSCDSSAYLALTPDDGTQHGDGLTSFKPMGFEVSFLKFLEHSTPPEQNPTRPRGRPPGKKSSFHTKDTCVEFSNRQNFEALGKVRIVVDGAYSVVAALLLKQLQDMRPTVMLEKSD